MRVVVLIRGDPVVSGHCVVCQICRQLLQGRVELGLRIGWRVIVSAIRAAEEYFRVVLGGVIILVAAIVLVRSAGKGAGRAAERYGILALRQRLVVRQINVRVFLVGAPGCAGVLEIAAEVLIRVLIGSARSERIVIV